FGNGCWVVSWGRVSTRFCAVLQITVPRAMTWVLVRVLSLLPPQPATTVAAATRGMRMSLCMRRSISPAGLARIAGESHLQIALESDGGRRDRDYCRDVAIPRIRGARLDALLAAPLAALFVAGPFAAGYVIRRRRERETELKIEGEERARVAVSDERARIARELHDVIAHAVSVVVLQSRGARKLVPPEEREVRDALDTIE